MRPRKQKKKRIRNIVCIACCSIQLLLVLLAFRGVGVLLEFLGKKDVKETVLGTVIIDEEEEEEDILTICLDAGHGGKDNGSGYQGRMEKDDNLKVAQAVMEYLKEKNVKVIMTRTDDTFLSLEERCDLANQVKADYFISLHRNNGEGNGIETWISSSGGEETAMLADGIMRGLESVGVQRNRGVWKGSTKGEDKDYYVNGNTNMPSCIVELGFINNVSDNRFLDGKLKAYAAAIGDAVLAVAERYGDKKIQQETPGAGEENKMEGIQQERNDTVDQVLQNQVVDNVTVLDSTSKDWGQGSNVDDKNRPVTALSYQESYGKYNAYFIGEDSQKIYLTFDEGYEYGYSESILNTLKEKGVAATFFVTKPYAKEQPKLVERMLADGHILGNHSVTHPAKGLPSQSIEQQQNEVLETHRYVKENFNYDMQLFRYPAGKFSEQSLAVVNNCNYKSVFWSFAYVDYDVNNQPDRAESLKKMVDRLHPGAIYLLHAESETNTVVLGEFIDRARAAGYEFAVFD